MSSVLVAPQPIFKLARGLAHFAGRRSKWPPDETTSRTSQHVHRIDTSRTPRRQPTGHERDCTE
jgi:hypothetical protein